jgi:hypothetical protein
MKLLYMFMFGCSEPFIYPEVEKLGCNPNKVMAYILTSGGPCFARAQLVGHAPRKFRKDVHTNK